MPVTPWLVVIILFMLVDMVTGFSQAFINKDLVSHKMSNGILKKFCLMIVLLSIIPLVSLIGGNVGLTILITIYTAETLNELISIMENMKKMNIDVEFMEPIFKLLRKDETKDGHESSDSSNDEPKG